MRRAFFLPELIKQGKPDEQKWQADNKEKLIWLDISTIPLSAFQRFVFCFYRQHKNICEGYLRLYLILRTKYPCSLHNLNKCELFFFLSSSLGYVSVGCYKDTTSRAIPILEGKDSILDGFYPYRVNPIAKCAVAAIRRGYHMFAVQDGGQCFASATAPMTFHKYGKSTACRNDGEGGAWANQVYVMKGTALT